MTTSMRVKPEQRHTRRNPCPVCEGGRDDPHGRGIRCFGFTSDDRLYAHCTREEFAGALLPDPDGKTWPHRLDGPCGCGKTHRESTDERGDAAERPRQAWKYDDLPETRNGYILTQIYAYGEVAGQPQVYEVRRFDLPDGSDKTYRPYSQRADGLWVEARLGDWPLYHCVDLAAAPAEAPIVFVEGEKCADAAQAALRAAGKVWPVTTTQGGSKNGRGTSLEALRGRQVVILPDNDEDGNTYQKTIADQARKAGASRVVPLRLQGLKLKGDVADWLADGHDGTELAQHVEDALVTAQPRPVLLTLADVTPERPRTLWPGYLWLGKIAVLDGDPGLSKSTITLDLAARVSRGREMPDGSAGIPPAHVILLSAEDSAADTIRPRLDAADGDPQRVHLLDGWQKRDSDTGEIVEHGMTLPGDLPILDAAIHQVGAQLVVIDPLMAFLTGDVNSYRDQDIRGALRPLAAIAERTGACVIIVRHLNKAAGGNAIYRGGGSIGIIGAARSGLLVAPDPDDPDAGKPGGRRVLALTKSNLSMPMPALGYRAVDADGAPRIEWLGAKDVTPTQLLSPMPDDDERSLIDYAVEYLRDALSNGPCHAKDILEKAPPDLRGRDNHPSKPMRAAKQRLKIETRRKGFGSDSYVEWSLPESLSREPDVHRGPHNSIGDHQNSRAPMDSEGTYGASERCPVTGGVHETARLRTADGWLKCIHCETVTGLRAPLCYAPGELQQQRTAP